VNTADVRPTQRRQLADTTSVSPRRSADTSETALIRVLAGVDMLRNPALREAAGLPERRAERAITRLRAQGLVAGDGIGGLALTAAGRAHPAAVQVRAERVQAVVQVDNAELDAARRQHELMRLRLETADFQARTRMADAVRERAETAIVRERARQQRALFGPRWRSRSSQLAGGMSGPALARDPVAMRALPAPAMADPFGRPRFSDLYGVLPGVAAANGTAPPSPGLPPAERTSPRSPERDLGQEFLAALAGPMAAYHAAHEQAQAVVDEQAWRARRSSHTPRPAPPLYEPEPEDEPAPTVLEQLGGGLRRLFGPRREPEPLASMPDTRTLELRVRRRS
jgi:hypothetical protein